MSTTSTVSHIAHVARLVRRNGFVAGGAARFAFAQPHGGLTLMVDDALRLDPQDIDIFGYLESSADRIVEVLMSTGMWRHRHTPGDNTILTHVNGELPVHIVRSRGNADARPVYGTPMEVINNFLVDIEQFALVGALYGAVLIYERTSEALAGVCDAVADYSRPSVNPFFTLMRLMKARSKGFKVNPETVLDLMEEWRQKVSNIPSNIPNKLLDSAVQYLEDESYG